MEKVCFLCGSYRGIILKTIGASQLSVESQPVKKRLGVGVKWPPAWELVVSRELSSAREAVKIEPERVKM
jgi:hypothetical protein